jgi:hypothetical protein
VQTEDKGVDSPLILTLVYTGGAILASKRVLYDDLLEQGFDEAALAERLSRQHKLICAAIRAGRLEDLKKMSQRDAEARSAQVVRTPSTPVAGNSPDDSATKRVEEVEPPIRVEIPIPASREFDTAGTHSTGGYAGVFEKVNLSAEDDSPEKPVLQLLNEGVYRAGEAVTLHLRLLSAPTEGGLTVPNAPVGVKILGTTFRPIILSAKTDREGLAMISIALPYFTSGRAAILIRAAVGGETVELRRMIHHS